MSVIQEISEEREKQRVKWGDKHDDTHRKDALAHVAGNLCRGWPDTWGITGRHPTRRERLVIAAALIAAEIECIDRRRDKATEQFVKEELNGTTDGL